MARGGIRNAAISLFLGHLELPMASSKKGKFQVVVRATDIKGQRTDRRAREAATSWSEWAPYDHRRCGTALKSQIVYRITVSTLRPCRWRSSWKHRNVQSSQRHVLNLCNYYDHHFCKLRDGHPDGSQAQYLLNPHGLSIWQSQEKILQTTYERALQYQSQARTRARSDAGQRRSTASRDHRLSFRDIKAGLVGKK